MPYARDIMPIFEDQQKASRKGVVGDEKCFILACKAISRRSLLLVDALNNCM